MIETQSNKTNLELQEWLNLIIYTSTQISHNASDTEFSFFIFHLSFISCGKRDSHLQNK